MRVAFNARLLRDPTLRGWNRYTINLLVELSSLGVDLFLYSDRPLHPSHLTRLPSDSYQVRIAPTIPYLQWEQYWLPKQCKKDRVDILHCPLNFGLPWSSHCPRILTLHDAIDRVYYSQNLQWSQELRLVALQNKMYHWVARNRADHIITVSEYSKQDIIKYFHIPEHKITVIYEAADSNFHHQVSLPERLKVREKYNLKMPYIFYLGGWEKRKNIPFLINAFAQANLEGVELVLGGGKHDERESLVELGKSLGIFDSLRLLGWVDDADLPALYAEALCFVYPSEYEGFGLQLCEAMSVGCPVFAANATCLPEVLGDGGDNFSLNDLGELTRLLQKVISDPVYYDRLKKRSLQHSGAFCWSKTAKETLQLYKTVASS